MIDLSFNEFIMWYAVYAISVLLAMGLGWYAGWIACRSRAIRKLKEQREMEGFSLRWVRDKEKQK
jgi:hypothetical protein